MRKPGHVREHVQRYAAEEDNGRAGKEHGNSARGHKQPEPSHRPGLLSRQKGRLAPLMAQPITKSNTPRRRYGGKMAELKTRGGKVGQEDLGHRTRLLKMSISIMSSYPYCVYI